MLIEKKQAGNIFLFAAAFLNIVLWVIFTPVNNGDPTFTRQLFAEVLSSTALVLFTGVIILATRPRFLEPYFGGLDRMYHSHRNTALIAVLLLIVHYFSVPLMEEGHSFEAPFGKLALAGVLLLIILAVGPRIPLIGRFIELGYHKWRKSHKYIGIFFIIGIIHTYNVGTIMETSPVLIFYFRIIVFAGVICYLYQIFFSERYRKKYTYVVNSLESLNNSTLEVTLAHSGESLEFNAGQFLFVHFPYDRVLDEPHPFTVSSAPSDHHLRLSIKASGDWTRYLMKYLKPGVEAKIEGGYGMFNYKIGGEKQIWISAGIGITPFLSWIRDFKGKPDVDVDLFYTARSEKDALFLDEIIKVERLYDNFRAHIFYSTKDGRLSADKIVSKSGDGITDKHIFLCGPLKMIKTFYREFRQFGVPARNIRYEKFTFR